MKFEKSQNIPLTILNNDYWWSVSLSDIGMFLNVERNIRVPVFGDNGNIKSYAYGLLKKSSCGREIHIIVLKGMMLITYVVETMKDILQLFGMNENIFNIIKNNHISIEKHLLIDSVLFADVVYASHHSDTIKCRRMIEKMDNSQR